MCRMECFSVLSTKFYYFLLILKIISWNWLAILHLYPRWSSQQHIYILFTLSSFFVCLHISPQTEGVRTLQIMSKTSHRAKIHRTGGQNPSYRGQKSNIPCYNFVQSTITVCQDYWYVRRPLLRYICTACIRATNEVSRYNMLFHYPVFLFLLAIKFAH